LAATFLFVGEEQRRVRGAEKERKDADCGVHPVGANADDEEDQEGGREGREGYGAENMGRGLVKMVRLRSGPAMLMSFFSKSNEAKGSNGRKGRDADGYIYIAKRSRGGTTANFHVVLGNCARFKAPSQPCGAALRHRQKRVLQYAACSFFDR
jgi:hypothetical protein